MNAAPERPALDNDDDPEAHVGDLAGEDYRPKTVEDADR